jgi:hypothetical protein
MLEKVPIRLSLYPSSIIAGVTALKIFLAIYTDR